MAGVFVTLFAPQAVVPRHGTASLVGVLKVAESTTVTQSELAAWGPGGVTTRHDVFGVCAGMELPAGTVGLRREQLMLVAPGWHELRWTVNTASGMAEQLVLGDGITSPPPEPLVLVAVAGRAGRRYEPDLLMRFVNTGDTVVDLAEALFGSAVLVGDVAHPHLGGSWDGWRELPPGADTWRQVSLEEYGMVRSPAPVELRLRYAGRVSALVVLHD